MRKLIFAILILSTVQPSPGVAQFGFQPGIMCSLGATNFFNQYVNTDPGNYARQIVNNVFAALCPSGNCGVIYLFSNVTAPNALTYSQGTGTSIIIFSPYFMNMVAQQFGRGAEVGVFAHELGHHIDLNSNPVSWIDSSWGRELRADAWAGCALARMKLDPSSVDNMLQVIAAYPSLSHPPWENRIPAVRAGYQACADRGLPDSIGSPRVR